MPIKTGSAGPRNAEIVIVGDNPNWEDETSGLPFSGRAGRELDSMLGQAGISRDQCFVTNLCKYRPPYNSKTRTKDDISLFFTDKKLLAPGPEISEGHGELVTDLREIKPKLIIPLGGAALWGVMGHHGITSWRGSVLQSPLTGTKVLPTYHPSQVLRMWHWRWIAVHDLQRAKRESAFPEIRTPPWRFVVRPNFRQAQEYLQKLYLTAQNPKTDFLPLSVDIETRRGHIACIGIGGSKLDAICIPFMDSKKPDKHYWSRNEEAVLIMLIRNLLMHKKVGVIGQNFLYDLQYLCKFWGLKPRVHFDTMSAHHLCFPGTQKGLDFLSSLYCSFHQYWKDEGKNFDIEIHDEERLWTYNCRDVVHTFECYEELDKQIDTLDRRAPWNFQMHELYPAVLGMMLRGVPVNTAVRDQLFKQVFALISERESVINYFAKRELNPRSPKQLQELFYDEFKLKPIIQRATGRPTTDDEAMIKIATQEPLLRKLCGAINEVRTLGNAINVIKSPIDRDGNMRCSYNIAGPETFRFSSSENAFGGGTNLQNLTSGKKSKLTGMQMPNMHWLLKGESDEIFCEADLDRADLQVVVWEANDQDLKDKLRANVDLHKENAGDLYGISPSSVVYAQRQVAKVFVHATNYFGQPRTVAHHCGLTVHQTELMQRRWFDAHPGIKDWHRRTEASLQSTRSVRNQFGYVRYYFERIEECLPEALGWVPQSTVAVVVNKILVNLDKHLKPRVLIRLQVHDSIAFTYKKIDHPTILQEIEPHTKIVVPYADPLIIPMSFKCSDLNWGECEPYIRGINGSYSREQKALT